jgi:O-antigen/teichoic acid export membrane protein
MKIISFLKSNLIKDFSYTFLGNVVYAGLMFVVNAIIARELGPSKFGVFSLLYALLLMITIFSDFGLSTSIAKFLPEYYAQKQDKKATHLLNLSLKIKLIGSSLLAVIGIILSPILSSFLLGDPQLTIYLIVVFAGGIGLSLYELLSIYFQAKQRFGVYSLYISFRAFIIFGMTLFCLLFSLLTILTSILLFTIIPSFVFLLTFLYGKGFDFSFETDKKDISEFIKFNIYIIIANVAGILISRIDLFYINYFLDAESVGYYSVANQLIQIIAIITTSITIILLPKVSKLTEISAIKSTFHKILKYAILLYICVFPLILAAPFLISLIYTSEYIPSIILFQLLALAFGLGFIINPLSTLVYKFNKSKIIAIMVLVRLSLIIFLEPIFLIFLQLNGIGVIYILNFSFALIYILLYLQYYLKKKKV